MIDFDALVKGPACSDLSAKDMAIMIDRELEQLARVTPDDLEDLREQLKEAQEATDDHGRESKALHRALEDVLAAHALVIDAREDVACVGVLLVPGPQLVKANEKLDSAIRSANSVAKAYDDGEL